MKCSLAKAIIKSFNHIQEQPITVNYFSSGKYDKIFVRKQTNIQNIKILSRIQLYSDKD